MAEALFVGEIAPARPPVTAAAELYVLSDGYGQPVGTDAPLLVETDDVAPLGPAGQSLMRYLQVPIEYRAACTVRVTPILDYEQQEAALTKTFPAPAKATRDVIDVPIASRKATTARARIEVVSRQGLVVLYTPTLVSCPLAGAVPNVVETV